MKKLKAKLTNGGLQKPALTHMRDVAYGSATLKFQRDVLARAERIRDDAGLLEKAEAKRQRRAQKRRQA